MKCAICLKKVTIVSGFNCDCSKDMVFCHKHRLRENHACPNIHKDKVNLEKIVADKVPNRL